MVGKITILQRQGREQRQGERRRAEMAGASAEGQAKAGLIDSGYGNDKPCWPTR
jgi:hypothetical protein